MAELKELIRKYIRYSEQSKSGDEESTAERIFSHLHITQGLSLEDLEGLNSLAHAGTLTQHLFVRAVETACKQQSNRHKIANDPLFRHLIWCSRWDNVSVKTIAHEVCFLYD